MPRTPLQFQRMKDERKLSILEASLPLFALYGKEKVSVDLISSKAKCSHGLVYHYFENVDEIYDELLKSITYKEIYEKLFKNYSDVLAFDALKNITSILMEELLTSDNNICFVLLLLSDTSKSSLFSLVNSLVKRGQKEGDVTGGNPSEITSVIFDMFKGMALPYLLNKKNIIQKIDNDILVEIFRKRSRL